MKLVKGFRFLLNLVLMCFASVFPKDSRIIIYGAWKGEKFADNPKYVFIEASKDKECRHIWISKNKDVLADISKKGYEGYYTYSLKGLGYQLRAKKAVLCLGVNDFYWPLLANKYILQLWHGIPLKKIMYHVYKPNFQERVKNKFYKKMYVLYTSDKYKEIYKYAFDKDEEHLLLCGQPRNDIFFDNKLINEEMDKKLKDLIGDKKIILYMPTHRNEGHVSMDLSLIMNLDDINRLCNKQNYVYLINKHFYHKNETPYVCMSNIIEVTNMNFDSQFLLAKADILVTDYSSCYVDYLLKDKPILFYQYDKEDYVINDREFYFDGAEVMPGEITYEFTAFYESLERVILNPEIHSTHLAVKDFFYNKECQSASSGKVLEFLKSL